MFQKQNKNARHLFILEISYILLNTIVVTESNSCGIARLDVIYKHEISVMDALKFQDRQEFRTCSDGDIRSTLCSPPNSRHCLQMLDQIVNQHDRFPLSRLCRTPFLQWGVCFIACICQGNT